MKEISEFDYGFINEVSIECVMKFGSIFDLPIVYDLAKEFRNNYSHGNILDLGAGNSLPYKDIFTLKDGKYYSLDNDPKGTFDFNTVDDIDKDLRFTLIIANQFFEHVDIQEGINIVRSVIRHLEPGGKVIITIPNIHHPIRFLSNVTHRTFWNYNNGTALYKYADLEVTKIARYSKRHPRRVIEKLLARYIGRIYRMDWCDSILMVGKKSA